MKLGVLISGRGSNLQALIGACTQPGFPAEIALVVSNRAEAAGLARAEAAGIATCVIDHTGYAERESFDAAMDARLRAAGVELVCLAGFMRLLSAGFVDSRSEEHTSELQSLMRISYAVFCLKKKKKKQLKYTKITEEIKK